ncbi:MAG: uracil-DNA glycosylase [Chloroflexi bacterium]|jgi:DNA polymerase|nr:uracil-DNA glycosylase [Chloroflexota bacterium]MBV6437349.1 Type-4 uracil-DNA glycosylase [Anaerolineae bacterium]MDL1915573.1 uracil-DNA glycosylase [Anaerolineae bacterium CFX4]OQY81218.1 MAG: uracil-DNA glycosylase [Anaerolineae bacterium UTCFX5]MBW7878088.1 uracil-DNA glycosylase [Anaerolineae bacterium]
MQQDRATALKAIADRVAACRACRLYERARNPVPGAGDPDAEIVFIGEGPGEQEDIQGLPFVGRSGQYLDYLLNLIGLKRSQVFIANVVKHRPPNNRDPQPDEIAACEPFLNEQLAVIDPLMIVTLGRFSMARYFPNAKISSIHGKPRYEGRVAYYPLFHPAAALRNPALRYDMEDDVNRIPSILAEVRRLRSIAAGIPDAPPHEDDPPRQLSLF